MGPTAVGDARDGRRRISPADGGFRWCGCRAAPARAADRCGGARASSALGRKSRQPLDQRMADIDAGRPAEPLMRRRLERQDREHVIDITAHGARPARPPCPDRGRDVIDDRDRRRRRAHAARDPVGEIRAVDDDESVGTRCDDGVRGLADAAQNHRQAPRNGAQRRRSTRSSIGNGLAIPAAAMARPPTPARFERVRRPPSARAPATPRAHRRIPPPAMM